MAGAAPGATPTATLADMMREAQDRLLFRGLEPSDVQRWRAQDIVLSPGTMFLTQSNGGPCGVLAVLQGFLVAHAVFEAMQPQEALVAAIVEIVTQAANGAKLCFVAHPNESILTATSPEQAKAVVAQCDFSKNSGVVRFVMSVVLSRGVHTVTSDMDDPDGTLTGRFGHCGQEMLNLLITGRAASQMHDGVLRVEGGLELRGVLKRPKIGFLTHLEALRLSKVGMFMKNPELPIWVIGSESHFTVLFSKDEHCDVKTPAQKALEAGQRAFGQLDSSENGFIDAASIKSLTEALGLDPSVATTLSNKCEDAGGILLFTEFWSVAGPILRLGGTGKPASEATPAPAPLARGLWKCQTCTYDNDPLDSACLMCHAKRPSQSASSAAAKPSYAASVSNQNQTTWPCPACTFINPASDGQCTMCLGARPAASSAAPSLPSPAPGFAEADEHEKGGRRIELVHVNGLIPKGASGPTVTSLTITTVDAALVTQEQGYSGDPFEETVHTKWIGCVVDYAPGVKPPSIKG